jgi:hypothetical protein
MNYFFGVAGNAITKNYHQTIETISHKPFTNLRATSTKSLLITILLGFSDNVLVKFD